MKKLLQSYYLYFCALALALVVWGGRSLLQYHEGFSLMWILPGVLLLLLLAGAGAARRFDKPFLPPAWVLWGCTILATVATCFCNMDAYRDVGQLPISILLCVGLLCALWGLLRYASLALWLPFLFFQLAQIAAYQQYRTRINSLVLAETFEASGEELAAYLSGTNLVYFCCAVGAVCLFGVLLSLLLRSARGSLPLLNAGFLFALLGLLYSVAVPSARRTPDTWWPVFSAKDLGCAFYEALMHNHATVKCVEALASPTEQPSAISTLKGGEGVVLVVHIGESVRSDRMSLNGYERDTTPWLRQQPGIISFTDCISAAHDTCQAQIAILTDARRDIYSKIPEMQPRTGSVLDLFHTNGFRLFSFFGRRAAQQLKYDRVVLLLTSLAEKRYNAPGSPWTGIPQIQEALAAAGNNNAVFFINNEGSHTPFEHYDRENPPFVPSVHQFENPADVGVGVNNAYDNTIHYTDEYIRRVCDALKGRPFVYVYVSDHGEYLGHAGAWGRAFLGENKIHYHDTDGCRVAMFVLASPEFESLHPHFAAALQNLRSHADMTVAHEHIFHTLLGLFDISTPYYNSELDLCSPLAQPYTGRKPQPLPHSTGK